MDLLNWNNIKDVRTLSTFVIYIYSPMGTSMTLTLHLCVSDSFGGRKRSC